MPKFILKCNRCGKYSLNSNCTCGGLTLDPRPEKYSTDDKWGKYRRIAKKK